MTYLVEPGADVTGRERQDGWGTVWINNEDETPDRPDG
jgi:hypothetical protein